MFSLRYLKIWVGGAILLLLCVCGLAAPLLAPRDPQAQTLEDRLRPPRWAENGSPAYLLGTDNLGRDMLSRIIYGSRISLMVGAATVIFAGFVGCTLGAVAGYFGHTADEVVSKVSEIFLAFPFLLIAIAIMAFLGQGVGNLIMALMLSRWVQYCRVVRGEVLSIRERDFVTAAKALGAKDWYVLFRHVVPNTLSQRDGDRDLRHGDRYHHRSEPELSRTRCAGAYPDLGVDAERGPKLYQPRAMAHNLSRAGDFYHRLRHQPIGRRPAGYFRSEVTPAEVVEQRGGWRSGRNSIGHSI